LLPCYLNGDQTVDDKRIERNQMWQSSGPALSSYHPPLVVGMKCEVNWPCNYNLTCKTFIIKSFICVHNEKTQISLMQTWNDSLELYSLVTDSCWSEEQRFGIMKECALVFDITKNVVTNHFLLSLIPFCNKGTI